MYKKLLTATAVSIALSGCLADDDRGTNSGDSQSTLEITGSAMHDTLTTSVSDPNGISGPIAYQWYADNEAIDGATESEYTVVLANAGQVIKVSANFVDDKGTDEVAADSVSIAADSVGEVEITGLTLVAGDVLTATLDDLDGLTTSTPTYTWTNQSGVELQSGASTTYTITAADITSAEPVMVTAAYVDDIGFDAPASSDYTAPLGAIDIPGVVTVTRTTGTGDYADGDVLTATVTDADGSVDGSETYKWFRAGVEIDGEAGDTYTLVAADDTGALISVEVSYEDEVFGDVSATGEADNVIFTTTVSSAAELETAYAAAEDGDAIGLAPGTYTFTETFLVDKGIRIGATAAATAPATSGVSASAAANPAMFTGPVCMHVTANNVVLDGLYFTDFDIIDGSECTTASSSSDYYLTIDGDNVTLTNSTFINEDPDTLAEASDGFPASSWVNFSGRYGVITRNHFEGHIADAEGGFLKLSSSSLRDGEEEVVPNAYLVEYNYFSGFDAREITGASAIFVGNDTTDAGETGNFIVRHNLIEDVDVKERLFKVQTSDSEIYANTFVRTSGMLTSENGTTNKYAYNVMLGIGDANEDSAVKYEAGIYVQGYGHEVFNNYFAGLANSSTGQRGAISLNQDEKDEGGNPDEVIAPSSIKNNTMINNNSPIDVDDTDGCHEFVLNFKDNLSVNNFDADMIVEGEDTVYDELAGKANDVGKAVIWNECGEGEDNGVTTLLTFNGDRFYAEKSLIDTGSSSQGSGNIAGWDLSGILYDDTEDAATASLSKNANGFFEQVEDNSVLPKEDRVPTGFGADVSFLHRIAADEVGPDSTWMSEVVYDDLDLTPVDIDFVEEEEEAAE